MKSGIDNHQRPAMMAVTESRMPMAKMVIHSDLACGLSMGSIIEKRDRRAGNIKKDIEADVALTNV